MGTRYRQLYMESVANGQPKFWVAPPASVIATDLGETLVHSILAGCGTWMIIGGTQYIASKYIDVNMCMAWSGIAAGAVLLAPIASDVAADFLCDIRQGWERGHTEHELEPEPVTREVEPTEEKAGAARVPGAWWYHDARGLLKCYHTPVGPARGKERPQPIISDIRMQRIFLAVEAGTPFSERAMCDKDNGKVPGLSSGPFRKLQDDWCNKNRGPLYIIRPDKSGYFTPAGLRIAKAIMEAEL
jgi:hypothetical protein